MVSTAKTVTLHVQDLRKIKLRHVSLDDKDTDHHRIGAVRNREEIRRNTQAKTPNKNPTRLG